MLRERLGRPSGCLLAADTGAFLAFGGQDVMVAGMGIAPAEAAVQGPGLHSAAGAVRVGHRALPQRSGMRFDRVRPRGVGRGETQLGLVFLRPATDADALVGGQVVQDHLDRCAVGPGCTDRSRRSRLPSFTGSRPTAGRRPPSSSRGSTGLRRRGGRWPAAGRDAVVRPGPRPRWAGSRVGRTRGRRTPGPGSGPERARYGPASPPVRGPGTPSLLPGLGALEGDTAAGEQAP